MRSWLEPEQWLISEAENGQVALERLADETPDVFLLDLIMPEMDGFQLILELQERSSWRCILVIVITALDLSAADRARLNSGVEGILPERNLAYDAPCWAPGHDTPNTASPAGSFFSRKH